ncbi:MAG: aminotransferase class V-fold PLP-dependent enzyme, partial [Gaiellales bacterium]
MLSIDAARDLWQPERPYLNTATFGLPPTPAFDAFQQALADWRHGRTSWEHWCDATDRSRELFGELVRVPAERVATGASLSYL